MGGITKFVNEILLNWANEVKRINMPQLKNKSIPDILELFDEYNIPYTENTLKVGKLKFIQDDYVPSKLDSMVKAMEDGKWKDSPIFISVSGYILDGNHRALAYKKHYGDDHIISVICINLPTDEALKVFSIGTEKIDDSIIKESPDKINVDNFHTTWDDKQAKAFGLFKGKMYISDAGNAHDNIETDDLVPFGYLLGKRGDFKYPGRIWINYKLLSFWEYPPKSQMKKIITQLEKRIDKKIWNAGYQIEVLSKNGKFTPSWKNYSEYGNESVELIPLETYSDSAAHTPTQHQLSPKLKKKIAVPAGVGSKKKPKDLRGGETMAQYHARTQQEGIESKQTIAVFPGRFNPFHQNHYDAYEHLVKKFGKDNVYIATSNKIDPEKSPFNFNEKRLIMSKMFGIPKNKIIQISNPYNGTSYSSLGDKNRDILVVGVGEKDADRLVSGKYYDKYDDSAKQPFANKAYTFIIPLKTMNVGGKLVTGTVVRNIFRHNSEKAKKQLFKKLYGKFNQQIYDLIVGKLNESVILSSDVIEEFLIHNDITKILKENPDNLINFKGIESIIKESPDKINVDNFYTTWKSTQAKAFGLFKGKMYISDAGNAHDNIETDDLAQFRIQFPSKSPKANGDDVGRGDFKYPGRIWIDHKLLSFWEYPPKSQMKKIITQLEKRIDKKIWNAGYQIEVLSKNGKAVHSWGAGGKAKLIPLETYSDSAAHTPTQHQLSPKLKKKIAVPAGVGSKKKPKDLRDDETMAQYHARTQQESVKLNEQSNAGKAEVDDGPATFYKTPNAYKAGSLNIKQKSMEAMTKQLGWQVINWLIGDRSEYTGHRYRENLVGDVSFGDVGVRDTDYNDPVGQYQKYMEKIANMVGYSVVNWLLGKNADDNIIDDPKKEMAKYEPLTQNTDNSTEPLGEKLFSKEWWMKELLTEGGAAGHMAHIFEDWDLTFADLKNIIDAGLEGTLEMVQEKADGQNLMISWKNGRLIAARNKGHLKNFGINALTKEQISDMFAGRGDIHDAFVFAMNDMENAVSKLSSAQINKIFKEGKIFMNVEVVYPATTNVIPYGISMIIFHGSTEYDESGTATNNDRESAKILSGMIHRVNQNIQKTFTITDNPQITVPKSQNFSTQKAKYITKLNTLQKKFKLKDSDEVLLYHQKWWEDFILTQADKLKYGIPNDILMKLLDRWVFWDKSFSVNNMKKEIDNEDFREWAIQFDKKDHKKQLKENIKPFELLFLELGAQILKNINTLLAVNPAEATVKMKNAIDKTIKAIESSDDISNIEKMKTELERLDAIGGLEAVIPTEGIVFSYNNKLYKFTGTFAPVNRLLGILKY